MKKFLLLAIITLSAASAFGQSRTNQITRPCAGSTTPAFVRINANGSISMVPCSGQTVNFGSSLTSGSVPYIGTSGVLSESNTALFWDSTNSTLKLGNKNYNVSSNGWSGLSYLQIGNNSTPYTLPNNGNGYGGKFDYYTTSPSGFTQTSGLRVRANVAASGGSATVTGVEAFVTNTGSSATTDTMQGSEGIAQVVQNASTVYGGYFSAQASSGGSGTTIGDLIGTRSIASSFNQFTTTNAYVFYGSASMSNGPTTNLYGLRLDNFGSTVVTNSYGIHLDNTIDVGTSSRYAIYSTSTSRSLFSGTVALANGSAVASAATIAISGNLFHVTGTTNITSVSGTGVNAGTCSTLIFDGVLTFTDGSNLKLAGNFVTTADDTITICYDGTNWYETARAVN